MIKENKKLKDLTFDEYAEFKSFKCGYEGSCSECVFRTGNCEGPDSPDSWFNNKEMYAESFLEQVLPVEKRITLSTRDKRYIINIMELFGTFNFTITKHVDTFLGDKVAYLECRYKSAIENYGEERNFSPLFNPEERFKELKENKTYEVQELDI